jgi:cephalosporin hydroxylase
VLKRRLKAIIFEHRIDTVVETGIDWGGSTRHFAEMVPLVIGIDNDRRRVESFRNEIELDGLQGIQIIHGNSPDMLQAIVSRHGFNAGRTLFFLDAHWEAYWPLRDEINVIPRGQGIIVMHDAVVPNCPDLGFDIYNGQPLSYEFVADALTVWSPGHSIEYNNDTARGMRRGALIVYPS